MNAGPASAGSNLYEVVNAAMCTFPDPVTAALWKERSKFIGELEAAGSAGALIHARLREGEEIPGFGHPLYPDGDAGEADSATPGGRFPGGVRRNSKEKSTIRKARFTKRSTWTWRVAVVRKVPGASGALWISALCFRTNGLLDRACRRAASKRRIYPATDPVYRGDVGG
jgi:Citrate synthase, C-terminal domain